MQAREYIQPLFFLHLRCLGTETYEFRAYDTLIVLPCVINCKVIFCFNMCFFNLHYAINCYFLIELRFLHDFIEETPYLWNSVPDLLCKISVLLEKCLWGSLFLNKTARKRCAALLKMISFKGFLMVWYC